jgi:Mg-chelatase subunit ChlD
MRIFSIPALLIAALFAPLVGSTDELDRALAAEKAEQTATAISIIFDNSGSMADDGKMAEAKSAFAKWLQNLPESYRLGLVDFYQGGGRLAVPLGPEQRAAVAAHVASAEPYGKTPIVACLEIVREQIVQRRAEQSPYERHVVVVFTDGIETVDSRGNKGVTAEIMKLRNLLVEVVGIGFHGEGSYMAPAVTRYFEADNEAQLVAGLSAVDSEIADDSLIEITAADLDLIQKTKIPLPPAPSAEKQ